MTGSEGCTWYVDAIPEYLAGRLSQEDAERVRQHLDACAECRNRANAVSLLQQTPVPAPDPGRWEEFVEGVVDRADRHRWRRRTRWLAVAAVIALVAAGALLWDRPGGGLVGRDSIDRLASEVAELSEIEAAAWTAGVVPVTGVPEFEGIGITAEELEQLLREVGRT